MVAHASGARVLVRVSVLRAMLEELVVLDGCPRIRCPGAPSSPPPASLPRVDDALPSEVLFLVSSESRPGVPGHART